MNARIFATEIRLISSDGKQVGVVETKKALAMAEEEDLDYFLETVTGKGIYTFSQSGDNLGERMRNAFLGRFKEGYKRIVIIGSDSPSLPLKYIKQALDTKCDMVLGPSFDGGFYLIGMQNKVFDGSNAAVAVIDVSGEITDEVISQLSGLENVIQVQVSQREQ